MGPYGGGGAADGGGLEGLAEGEVVVHHESHAHADAVSAYGEVLYPAELAQGEIEGIEVVAQAVAAREKRFAGILCAHNTDAEVFAVGVVEAYAVSVFVAQIAVCVAFAGVEGDVACGCKRVFALAHEGLHTGESLALPLAHADEAAQERPLDGGEALDRQYFLLGEHPVGHVYLLQDFHYLAVGEEGDALEVFPGGCGDVHGVCLKVAQQVVYLIPVLRLAFLVYQGVEEGFPLARTAAAAVVLCMEMAGGSKDDEDGKDEWFDGHGVGD